jgi:hypothetical protein
MAELSINFTPVPGINSYSICYKPVGATTFTCVEDSGPIVITTGIECGIAYDVTVTTNCPEGEYSSLESIPATATAAALQCPPPNCISYTISTSAAGGRTSEYIDCDGNPQEVTIGGASGYDAQTFCAQENSVVLGVECDLTTNGPCGEEPTGNTLNVEGASGYMEPCVGGTIDDFMGASVYLSAPVSVDTVFDVNVLWTNPGAGCAFPYQQSFGVTVLAGQTSSNFSACNNGYYISSGADICGAVVTGHNNTVDTITF